MEHFIHRGIKSKQSSENKMVKESRERKPAPDIVVRDYTIHMSKRLYNVTFKNRAPRAVREIKKFAEKTMKTK